MDLHEVILNACNMELKKIRTVYFTTNIWFDHKIFGTKLEEQFLVLAIVLFFNTLTVQAFVAPLPDEFLIVA